MKTRALSRRRFRVAFVVAATALGLIAMAAGAAWARPGGGGSYSGGGGGSSGGGGGSIGDLLDLIELILWIVELTLDYPLLMLPLLAIGAGFLIYAAASKPKQKDWTVGAATPPSPTARQTPQRRRPALAAGGASAPSSDLSSDRNAQVSARNHAATAFAAVRQLDADFSQIVFEDFLYALYEKAHGARSPSELAQLAPFLSPAARAKLDRLHSDATAVNEVVIGAMAVGSVQILDEGGESWIAAEVAYEVNYTEQHLSGPVSWYARESWSLRRKGSARSRRPEAARVFQCPSCGASLQGIRGNTCSHCRQQVDTGDFDWVVISIDVTEREERGPQLTREVQEQGTDLPTLVDADRSDQLAALKARDPSFALGGFEERVKLIFAELQVAWSTRDWKRARPFLSDSLFQMELGYIDAYLRAQLKNITENARVDSLVLVKAESDRYYDALTIRLYAASLDYTVSDEGKLICGSRSRVRQYSEYWTLIRGVGVRGPARTDKNCPNCGAPLQVNMAGSCEYCQARISCGDFDWVLSRIEQDESYQG